MVSNMFGIFKKKPKKKFTKKRNYNGQVQVYDSYLNRWVYISSLNDGCDYSSLPSDSSDRLSSDSSSGIDSSSYSSPSYSSSSSDYGGSSSSSSSGSCGGSSGSFD